MRINFALLYNLLQRKINGFSEKSPPFLRKNLCQKRKKRHARDLKMRCRLIDGVIAYVLSNAEIMELSIWR